MLEAKSTDELWGLRAEATIRLDELSANFMQLRSGGCAMDALLETARADLTAIEAELERRGEEL